MAYFSLLALIIHANESQDHGVTGPKVMKFFTRLRGIIADVNATIVVVIRLPVVE